ncbi:hypothetical protein NEOC65_001145 [Neochlamydia sp. AcF65]|nr:hypothetical protein [Neochlamydia sp. AcF65]
MMLLLFGVCFHFINKQEFRGTFLEMIASFCFRKSL